MISVITYGRNDSHGYNLAKRAALSFNCIAELLDDRDDEILFVDCNSEDEFATFPEAIADTLTPKARKLLRVFRVRRSLYETRRNGSTLPVLESFSRNVALRRANAKNRWVLSTNPDMIFLIRTGNHLRRLLTKLPDGYYATPRYELPESLWESYDRTDPRSVLKDIRFKPWQLGLHLAVRSEPWCGYDAPGDFQLLPLKDAVEIGGFHEGMLRGWHVDANFAKRCSIFYGREAHLIEDRIFAYHMMHLRVLSSAHTGKAVKRANSWDEFVDEVIAAFPPDQPDDWGAPELPVEEISLTQAESFYGKWLRRVQRINNPPCDGIQHADYSTTAGLNANLFSDLHRISTFLVNEFDHLPPGLAVVAWSGNKVIRDLIRGYAKEKNWTASVQTISPGGNACSDAPPVPDNPDIVVLDFTLHFATKVPEYAPPGTQPWVASHRCLYKTLRDLYGNLCSSGFRKNPRIYCLGATHTMVEEALWAIPASWDAIPFAIGFKRGRMHPVDDASLRLDANAGPASGLPDTFWTEACEAALRTDPGLEHTAGSPQMGPAYSLRTLFFLGRLSLAEQIIAHKDTFLSLDSESIQELDRSFFPTFDNDVFINFRRREGAQVIEPRLQNRWLEIKRYYGFEGLEDLVPVSGGAG